MRISFILVLILWFSNCTKADLDSYNKAALPSDSLTSYTDTEDVQMELIQEGALKVHLVCKKATKFNLDNKRYSLLDGPVFFNVYDESGTQTMKGSSESGVYYEDTAEFNLIGDVKIFTNDNRRLFTEDTLIWNQQFDLLETNNFTIVVTPNDSLSGYGLKSNLSITEYDFRKISGNVAVDE